MTPTIEEEALVDGVSIALSVADPGFGQGGGPRIFFRDFADIAKLKSGKQSEQYNISI